MEKLRIRRGFVDVAGGQVHYREAGSGGTPLILLHPSPGSGRMLQPLLQAMAGGRRVIALDARGNGDSDPLSGEPEIADFARATWEAINALGIERCDLFGSHTGASIAMEASIQAPGRVGHLIIDNMALWSKDRQTVHIATNSPAQKPDMIGSQFIWAWHYCRDQYLFAPWYERTAANRRTIDMPSPETLHAFVMEVLKGLETFHMSYSAVARYDKRARLPMVTVATLVTSCPSDPLMRYVEEVRSLVRGAVLRILGDVETDDGAAASASVYAAFLDDRPLSEPFSVGDDQVAYQLTDPSGDDRLGQRSQT